VFVRTAEGDVDTTRPTVPYGSFLPSPYQIQGPGVTVTATPHVDEPSSSLSSSSLTSPELVWLALEPPTLTPKHPVSPPSVLGGVKEEGAVKGEEGEGKGVGEREGEGDPISTPGRFMVRIGASTADSDRTRDLGPSIRTGAVDNLKSHLKYGKWKSMSYAAVL
jgi:hypothetical protein